MKRILSYSLFVLMLCSFSSGIVTQSEDYLYSIDQGSTLSIAGSSNINSFDCFCNENFTKRSVKIQSSDTGKTFRFSSAVLKLRTQSLDCNNSRMNSDLCDALKSEQYPFIFIELHEASLQRGTLQSMKTDEWTDVTAIATLTITNARKPIILDVRVKKLGNDRYRFICAKDMRMTDFKVEPPTALFGLIKVHNEIKINFDLYTTLSAN